MINRESIQNYLAISIDYKTLDFQTMKRRGAVGLSLVNVGFLIFVCVFGFS